MLLFVAVAHGFVVDTTDDGRALRWPELPIPVMVIASDEDTAAIQRALGHWQTVEGATVAFAIEAPGSTPRYHLDDDNYVWTGEDWPFDPAMLALTSHWSDNRGALLAFDIRINGDRPWSNDGDSSSYDLEAAITHELGHALGLEHSGVPGARMFPTLPPGPIMDGLHPDDIAAARFLYPAHPTGCSSTTSLPMGLLASLIAAGLTRKTRRRL